MRMTAEQVRDHMARTRKEVPQEVFQTVFEPVLPEDPHAEKELHRQIVQYCNLKGWVCFHGAMNKKTHRTEGEPDFHCLLPGGRVLFVECKTASGKLSEDQLRVQTAMAALGHTMHVVRSMTEFLVTARDEMERSV